MLSRHFKTGRQQRKRKKKGKEKKMKKKKNETVTRIRASLKTSETSLRLAECVD